MTANETILLQLALLAATVGEMVILAHATPPTVPLAVSRPPMSGQLERNAKVILAAVTEKVQP